MNTNQVIEIPGYTILREIGKGGMATVYLALQERLDRQVALKVMNAALAMNGNFTERFIKEGQVIDQLRHPLIIPLFEFGHHGDCYYFSMEFLSGGTLSPKIQDGMTPEQAFKITRLIAEALAYAHQRNIIHRDIKPQNVLFRQDGTLVLSDFGIAKVMDSDATNLTLLGTVVGSLRYMSPEQAASKALDARSDLYSLGVVLYEMLTKKTPYQASDIFDLAMLLGTGQIPVLPPEFAQYQPLLNKLLALHPDDRFANAERLIQAIDQTTSHLALHAASTGTITRIPTPKPETVNTDPATASSSGIAPPPVLTAPKPAPQTLWIKNRLALGGLFLAVAIAIIASFYFLVFRPAPLPNGDSAAGPAQQQATPSPSNPMQSQIESLLEQARIQRRQGALAESLALIEQGLRLSPQQLDLLTLRAQVQIELDHRNRITTLLQDCATRFPLEQLAHGDQDAAAVACYDRILVLDPSHSAALTQQEQIIQQLTERIDAALRQGALDQAQTDLAQLRQMRPEHPSLSTLHQALQLKQDQAAEAAQRQAKEAAQRKANAEQVRRSASEERIQRRVEEAAKRKPAEAARPPTPVTEAKRQPTRPTPNLNRNRCGNLLSRITLGEPVSSEDRAFITKECR